MKTKERNGRKDKRLTFVKIRIFFGLILFFLPLHDIFLGTVSNFLNTYSIHFKGLKVGKHLFDFVVDKRFFDEFEEGEIRRGQLKVDVVLSKQSQMLDLTISIDGDVEVVCDRCLDNFVLPISFNGSLFVKFGEEKGEVGDEIIVLTNDDNEINLAQPKHTDSTISRDEWFKGEV
jgi:hypothetical protein